MRVSHFISLGLAVVLGMFCGMQFAFAQSDSGLITGRVTDPAGAVLSDAQIDLTSIERGTVTHASSNRAGIYVLPNVAPGRYNLSVSHAGFRQIDLTNLTVNVQANIEQNVKLSVGSVSESVTVNDQGTPINTTDASVGTIIDRQFVENIPMNGRSFQTLVLLSPGVVTNNPNSAENGEYSVNGQRTDGNGFYVDGTSASNTINNASSGGQSGMLPSATALGTTQAMLQLDAMEEFHISTSSYSSEFGNHPGAQISFRSRSGTNMYHGTAFDYLRNVAFDADNWFNTYSTMPTPAPAEHQNDFGGTFGGPVSIPHLYSGHDRTFFFFSYEGLRLHTPSAANINQVPTNGTYITNYSNYAANPKWANLRQYAPAGTQALLNSFPLPNCNTSIDPQCVDLGLGSSPYLSSQLTVGVIDSLSARVDFQATSWLHLFARYADTISNVILYGQIGGPYTNNTGVRTRTFLLGIDNSIGSRISNELRLQYSPATWTSTVVPFQVGGAQPYNLFQAQGISQGETYVRLYLPNETSQYTQIYGRSQFQPNATEALIWTHGKHLFKFGGSYLQSTAYFDRDPFSRGPLVDIHFTSAAQILNGIPGTEQVDVFDRQDPTAKQWGLYAQDEWRAIPRLTLSLGLRWDLAPAPSISGAQQYTYTGNANNPSTLGLSAQGAPLYATKWTDFAPRVGVAYVVHNQPGHQTVFRAGGGLFYDSIAITNFFGSGNALGTQSRVSYATQFPLTQSQVDVAVTTPACVATTGSCTVVNYPANNIVPPYTLQWNAALEQSFGSGQSITIGYVAAAGHKLSTYQNFSYTAAQTNKLFTTMDLYVNGPGSNYNSLQVKYHRQMAHGLQILASYTWAHSIDSASNDSVLFPLERADSDHDVRHNFTGAAVYMVPAHFHNRLEHAVLSHWNADLWFVARTAFPYQPTGANVTDPTTGDVYFGELNWTGRNPYIHVPGIPGGRQIDPAQFSITTTPRGVGTLPRNMLRAFGELQQNVAIGRTFPIYGRSDLEFRAEAFNISNHPNFGAVYLTCGVTTPGSTCDNPEMGQASNTLNTGLGNLNSLYQQGGPRSLEFMLKLHF